MIISRIKKLKNIICVFDIYIYIYENVKKFFI
jgi:hypothetical protein